MLAKRAPLNGPRGERPWAFLLVLWAAAALGGVALVRAPPGAPEAGRLIASGAAIWAAVGAYEAGFVGTGWTLAGAALFANPLVPLPWLKGFL